LRVNIPYAVAVNGIALPAFSTKPERVSGAGGRVIAFVDPASQGKSFYNPVSLLIPHLFDAGKGKDEKNIE